jgi:hypothetical protein
MKYSDGKFLLIARMTSHIPDKGQVAVIEMAARPDVYCRCGQEERFTG